MASARAGARPARALARADLLLNGLSVHLDEDERPVGILAKHPDRGPDGSGATVQALPETPRRRLSTPASGDLVLVLLEAFASEDPEDLVRPSDPARSCAAHSMTPASRRCARALLIVTVALSIYSSLGLCFKRPWRDWFSVRSLSRVLDFGGGETRDALSDVARSPGFNRCASDRGLTP